MCFIWQEREKVEERVREEGVEREKEMWWKERGRIDSIQTEKLWERIESTGWFYQKYNKDRKCT